MVGIAKEKPKLEAKQVLVTKILIEKKEKSENMDKDSEIVVLMCEHADSDKPLKMTKCKFISKGKIVTGGLWYSLDKEGNIPYNSALAQLMRYYQVSEVEALKGLKMSTSQDENGFLVLKAY